MARSAIGLDSRLHGNDDVDAQSVGMTIVEGMTIVVSFAGMTL